MTRCTAQQHAGLSRALHNISSWWDLTVASGDVQPSRHVPQCGEAVCKVDVVTVEDGETIWDADECREAWDQQPSERDLQDRAQIMPSAGGKPAAV